MGHHESCPCNAGAPEAECRCDAIMSAEYECGKLFGFDLDRARKAKEMLEAVEWMTALRYNLRLCCPPEGLMYWQADSGLFLSGKKVCEEGDTLPEAVAALKARIGGEHD